MKKHQEKDIIQSAWLELLEKRISKWMNENLKLFESSFKTVWETALVSPINILQKCTISVVVVMFLEMIETWKSSFL